MQLKTPGLKLQHGPNELQLQGALAEIEQWEALTRSTDYQAPGKG